MKIPLTRKQTAPKNVAAKALREGQYQPKVEADPKAYSRKAKHRDDPKRSELEPDDEASSE